MKTNEILDQPLTAINSNPKILWYRIIAECILLLIPFVIFFFNFSLLASYDGINFIYSSFILYIGENTSIFLFLIGYSILVFTNPNYKKAIDFPLRISPQKFLGGGGLLLAFVWFLFIYWSEEPFFYFFSENENSWSTIVIIYTLFYFVLIMDHNTKLDKKNKVTIRLFYFSLMTITTGVVYFLYLYDFFGLYWLYANSFITLISFILMLRAFLKNKEENSHLVYYFPRQVAIISTGLLLFSYSFF